MSSGDLTMRLMEQYDRERAQEGRDARRRAREMSAPGTRSKDATIVVDAAKYELLIEVASLAASLLPYTEQMAAASRPNEYCQLAESLQRLAPLLTAQTGAGKAVDQLLALLQDLEQP